MASTAVMRTIGPVSKRVTSKAFTFAAYANSSALISSARRAVCIVAKT